MPKKQRKKLKSYDNLKQDSKTRFSNLTSKIHKAGFTIKESKSMDWKLFREVIGLKSNTKKASVIAQQRVLNQITATKERKSGTVKLAIKTYEKEGWKMKGLEAIRKELVKVVGNTFFDVAEKIEAKYYSKIKDDKLRKDKIYQHTRELLAIAKKGFKNLTQKEKKLLKKFDRDLLREYGSP